MRLHYLVPDTSSAPAVATILEMFNAGFGYGAIVARLTREGFPCPSAHDPGRNRHRRGVWSRSAELAILSNPVTPAPRFGRARGVTGCSST
ncbi:MAG TPA: recombinase family protein [Acidimicrobiales bacterium]|nr:recombinase family protein [Acidimicrobiales bacterium]